MKKEECKHLVRRKDLDNDDFALAMYLSQNNWDTWTSIADVNAYYDKDKRLIAMAFLDSRNYTYTVRALKEEEYVDAN